MTSKTADRRVVLYIAASLDGFIARSDGSIDWLDEIEAQGDNGYSEFIQTVDTLIMGRVTYEQVLTFGRWPYENKKVYVYSHTRLGSDDHAEFTSEDAVSLIRRLRQSEGSGIWLVGGAEIIEPFVRNNLIDEYVITVIPVLLGSGISMFRNTDTEIKLKLENTVQYGQAAQLIYSRQR